MFDERKRLERHQEQRHQENQKKRLQEVPLHEVIYRDIETRISSGQLKPWMWLESIRQTAKAHAMSVITVKSAYERLQANGLIISKPGIGYFVAENATEKIKAHLVASAENSFERGIQQAYRAGLDDKAVIALVNDLLDLLE